MSETNNLHRRLFLKQGAALASCLGAGAPLALQLAAMSEAAAQSATDYKAAVCVFLTGGNDSFNTVLPTDADSWAAYREARDIAGSSIALLAPGTPADSRAALGSPAQMGGVRPVKLGNVGGRGFAVHPMLSRTQGLINSGRMSVLANVGPLVEPLSRAEYQQRLRRRPVRLFSHNDQQNMWQSFQPEGALRGWGGLIADAFAGSNSNSLFTALSCSGNAVWLTGREVRQYQLGSQGAIRFGQDVADANLRSALQRVASAQIHGGPEGLSHLMQREVGAVGQRNVSADATLGKVLPPATDPRFGPDARLSYTNLTGGTAVNPLAQQLQMVARTMAAREALGMRRQVFFVSLGGFDTHDNQNAGHAELMLKLDHALAYFAEVLQGMGMQDQVLTFTASEFGRTLSSNGDGTDHGWGGHHFVMGGGLAGGLLHGKMPVLVRRNTADGTFNASDVQIESGVLVPTTAVDQLAYSVGRWMGAPHSHLLSAMPNLANFGVPQAF